MTTPFPSNAFSSIAEIHFGAYERSENVRFNFALQIHRIFFPVRPFLPQIKPIIPIPNVSFRSNQIAISNNNNIIIITHRHWQYMYRTLIIKCYLSFIDRTISENIRRCITNRATSYDPHTHTHTYIIRFYFFPLFSLSHTSSSFERNQKKPFH